jgi:hypothetical protein
MVKICQILYIVLYFEFLGIYLADTIVKNMSSDWYIEHRYIQMYGWLINCLLFYVPLKNFSLDLDLCSALRAFEQGGIFIVPHLLWHGASVFLVSSKGPPHSVASYDTRGDVKDSSRVWMKDMASFLLLHMFFNGFWTYSASHEYKNKSANKRAQPARPQECQWTRPPKTTQTLSTRKPSILSMSTSEFEVNTGGSWWN